MATGDTSGMVSAGNAAREEVENNYLSVSEKSELEIAKQKLRNSKDSVTSKTWQSMSRPRKRLPD